MQAFYWDCPSVENREFQWWKRVQAEVAGLRKAGFSALWLPPASKAASARSMGYDVYDYYDLGNFDQKGSVPTWFGSRADLAELIRSAHENGMQVYADIILNHNNGGDQPEVNPIDNVERWTKFEPQSEKFSRTWKCFHPSPYETWDGENFGQMPDLCHRNPAVYGDVLEYARWLVEEVGFDGFRYDFVKGYGSWICTSIQELRMSRTGQPFKPFGVGECWDSDRVIFHWLDQANEWSDNPVCAFDFPLREKLKRLCDQFGFSLKTLVDKDTVSAGRPDEAVTFVGNHDICRTNDIVNDKMLAYAYILTHEGYPCVFWQDYFNYGLAKPDSVGGINALVRLHEDFAGGATEVLHADDNLYVMQRTGSGAQKGLVFVLNNRGDAWNGGWVQTKWSNTRFTARAWYSGVDLQEPGEKWTGQDGWGEFWAPPRGYAVYVPQ